MKTRRLARILTVCLTLGFSVAAWVAPSRPSGDIYRWKDNEGRIHFTDNPETIPIESWNRLPGIALEDEPDEKTGAQRTRVTLDHKRGAIRLPVIINGEHRIRLFLDTGATYCQITRDDAVALGLDVDHLPPVEVLMADGRSLETQMVVLNSLKIGSLEIRGVKALVGDLPLLGLNVLSRFKVILDLPKGEVTLESPP